MLTHAAHGTPQAERTSTSIVYRCPHASRKPCAVRSPLLPGTPGVGGTLEGQQRAAAVRQGLAQNPYGAHGRFSPSIQRRAAASSQLLQLLDVLFLSLSCNCAALQQAAKHGLALQACLPSARQRDCLAAAGNASVIGQSNSRVLQLLHAGGAKGPRGNNAALTDRQADPRARSCLNSLL
jgi:hypothetical protein